MKHPRIIVCGGRGLEWSEWATTAHRILDEIGPSLVAQGGADGADMLARDWARRTGTCLVTFEAPWPFFLKAAGPIRNGWMLEVIKPDLVLAFPGGKGTADMIEKAERAGVPVRRVEKAAEPAEGA